MGLSHKRSRNTRDRVSDLEKFDHMENNKLSMREQYYEDDNAEKEDVDESEEEEEEEVSNEEAEESEGDGSEQNDIDKGAEMDDLEKEYIDLRNQEQDILKNLKRHKDEDLLKGRAVKNQKALWDKALEFRFLLQKAFYSSNRLPQEPVRSTFCDSDEAVSSAYADVITSSKNTLKSLLELQEALLNNNPSIAQSSNGNYAKKHSKDSGNVEDDEEWTEISQMHNRIASFRDKSVDKWQRKTQVTTGAAAIRSKLHAFNQNVSEQVAAHMRDPSRMVKQMELRKSTVGVFGAIPAETDTVQGEEACPDGDPELLDDSEFYQQLLKEFFESIDPASSETAFYALKRLQTKKRKIVDRRASKSRKIRYNVHDKIVNFMAPRPMNLPPMTPKLFQNLFGLKSKT